MRTGALVIALVLGLTGGCSKTRATSDQAAAGSGAAPHEMMPPVERTRGLEACQVYVTRACACAVTAPSPTTTTACSDAKSMNEALGINLDIGSHPDSTPQTMAQLQRTARKLVDACITNTATLAAQGCT